jgi:TFIIS helical bundle-like domain
MEPPVGTATAAIIVPLGRSEASFASRTGQRARLAMEDGKTKESSLLSGTNNATGSVHFANCSTTSLVSMCLSVVVTSLEKYAPESFGILSEEDFEEIVQLRHRRTSPREGSGGLDGTGRVAPALSDKFLAEVEWTNPHLSESAVVDRLVWKDCVNFRFREGGLTRPAALSLPWPMLVDMIRESAEMLQQQGSLDSPDASEALQALEKCPMNVPLLQATGVGKAIRKYIKARTKNQPAGQSESDVALFRRLECLLNSWMDMAENDSATIGQSGSGVAKPSSSAPKDTKEDLRIAESCQSWRQLFQALKDRADSCRTVQGERMRKIRSNLARDRPKVVKVRPASASASAKHSRLHSRIGGEKSATPPSPHASRMSKLWKETAVVAQRSQRPSGPTHSIPTKRTPASSATSFSSPSPSSKSSSFGAAVAFAAAAKRSSKGSTTHVRNINSLKAQSKVIQLTGGKQMCVPKHNPAAVARGGGAVVVLPARNRASSKTAAPPPPAKVRRTEQR